jgi:hypothetical protein
VVEFVHNVCSQIGDPGSDEGFVTVSDRRSGVSGARIEI